MTTQFVPKSRTEALALIAREHGRDFLFDAIYEARVGVSNAFTDTKAMDSVLRTARRMLEKGATS